MNELELGPAEHFEAGAEGEPGQRVFYVHLVAGGEAYWFLAEKGQVAELADRAVALLLEASIHSDPDAVSVILGRLGRAEPDVFRFRVGTITLRASEGGGLVDMRVESADETQVVTFQVVPEQLHAMASRAAEVVAAGRELCDRCRLPKDPSGHQCPSTNGYHAH